MNPCIKKMQYAVRGPLVIRATEIEKVRWVLNESFSSSSLHTWYQKIYAPLSWIAVIGCPSKSKRNCSDSWNCAAFWQPAISSHRWAEYLIRLQKRLFNESFYCHFICPLILTGTSSRCQETLWLGEWHIWNCVQALKWISTIKVIKANIGDAHAMGNKPIVFIRQVHDDLRWTIC